MKRSGFKSKAPARPAADPDRVRTTPTATPGAWRAPQPIAFVAAVPVLKDDALRSEPYRRLVAAMPCAHCRIEGLSQHAHENLGKGLGLKVDDRKGMPLCCTQPGREGCHEQFDQGRLLPGGREAHREAGARWAAETRADIINKGQWPAKLPLWKETP